MADVPEALRICRHGGLRRSCETCDLAAALEQARQERDQAQQACREWLADIEREIAYRQTIEAQLVAQDAALQGLIQEVILAYYKAVDLWSSQCFCFTSASESLRRDAHETAREGFLAIADALWVIVKPTLKAEFDEASRLAREEAAVRTARPKGQE